MSIRKVSETPKKTLTKGYWNASLNVLDYSIQPTKEVGSYRHTTITLGHCRRVTNIEESRDFNWLKRIVYSQTKIEQRTNAAKD